jgi:anti-anti-sigma regulatory factor
MFIRKDKVNDELVISIRGDISEKSEEVFNQLIESDLEPSFVFDLGKVQMINSIGVRAWISMTVKLKKRKSKVIYRNCTSSIIDSVNLFPDFADKQGIESFFIPLTCSRCDHKMEELVTPTDVKNDSFETDETCPTCNIKMEPAVDLEEYLSFIAEN